jgi:predicted metal-dependent phosphoesterase TrpH
LDCNERSGIDLHIHSTASDGSLQPSEILSMAQGLNLSAISITDHDTIDGLKEAIKSGIPPSLKFLTGVEISVSPPDGFSLSGSMHILGYAFVADDPLLNQALEKLRFSRENRNPKIIERLNELGMKFSLDEVIRDLHVQGQLGRPHIASFMVKNGFAESIDDAFKKYLGNGKPAYVNKYRLDCATAIEIIRGAGGIPVLAHPKMLPLNDDSQLEALVIKLTQMGLQGIEAYYPEHHPDDTSRYVNLAKKHGLMMTGGTDFHGALKPDICMGSGNGDFFVPYEIYERLLAHR